MLVARSKELRDGGLIIQGTQAAHNNSRRIIYHRYVYFWLCGFFIDGVLCKYPYFLPDCDESFYLLFRIFPIPKSRYTRTFLSNTAAHHQYIVPLLVQEKE